MTTIKHKLILNSLAIVFLFSLTNALVNGLQLNQLLQPINLKASLFVTILYGWALFRLFTHKRFAFSFFNFVNFVYSAGFLSYVAIASVQQTKRIAVITITLSLLGLMSILMIWRTAKQIKA